MTDQKLTLSDLTILDLNKILTALGALPFREVFELIGKIESQAQSQIRVETVS